jgi:ABC-type multidrug transport system fused ATPase/permease subunit
VLEDIDIEVLPRQKVGIAGRTGAGKSSLIAALFRMPDPRGKVLIDGVDLGLLDIQAARRAMAVITQDPVLFAGSLRKNLDPFDKFDDDAIWTALEEVQLKVKIQDLKGGLNFTLAESGMSLSVGERQLLCLARALLQRCKILIMDEATANVDFKTDRLIQQVIRVKFSNCTVLTIAHRLNTIMDYDKVLVMNQGHVVEFDTPRALAGKQTGVFAGLLRNHNNQEHYND